MRLTDILSPQRILIDGSGTVFQDKRASLVELSRLLSPCIGVDEATVCQLLVDRENLQSTGIGDGVAIPHASTDRTENQAAALLISPSGIDFQSMDGAKVHIIFGVVGPRRATGEHLKTLARISRLLRDSSNRCQLIGSADAASAFALIRVQDAAF
jgi:nitrogen PTS system EIIA component